MKLMTLLLSIMLITMSFTAFDLRKKLDKQKHISEAYRQSLLNCENSSGVDKLIDKIRKEP